MTACPQLYKVVYLVKHRRLSYTATSVLQYTLLDPLDWLDVQQTYLRWFGSTHNEQDLYRNTQSIQVATRKPCEHIIEKDNT